MCPLDIGNVASPFSFAKGAGTCSSQRVPAWSAVTAVKDCGAMFRQLCPFGGSGSTLASPNSHSSRVLWLLPPWLPVALSPAGSWTSLWNLEQGVPQPSYSSSLLATIDLLVLVPHTPGAAFAVGAPPVRQPPGPAQPVVAALSYCPTPHAASSLWSGNGVPPLQAGALLCCGSRGGEPHSGQLGPGCTRGR